MPGLERNAVNGFYGPFIRSVTAPAVLDELSHNRVLFRPKSRRKNALLSSMTGNFVFIGSVKLVTSHYQIVTNKEKLLCKAHGYPS